MYLYGYVDKCQNSEFEYDYFTVKNCGILENLGIIMRDSLGVLLWQHEYLNNYLHDYYKFIYSNIKKKEYKENQKIGSWVCVF